jgi:hypothetical protein
VVDIRGDLLDMAEMHVQIIATVVATSFVHTWTIALGARICRRQLAALAILPMSGVAGASWMSYNLTHD